MDQLRDGLLHDTCGMAELTKIRHLLESRMVVIGSLDDFAVDHPLGPSKALRTYLIRSAAKPVVFQNSYMAVWTDIWLVSDRLQMYLHLLYRAEMKPVEGVHLAAAFRTLANRRLVDLMLENQDEDPSYPDGQPTGKTCQTVFVGLFIQCLRERFRFRVLVGDTQRTQVLSDANPSQENQHRNQQDAAVVKVVGITHAPSFDEIDDEKDRYG